MSNAARYGRKHRVIADVVKGSLGCERCCVDRNLQGHHIVAIADGGPDVAANISVLCHECHQEWHRIESSALPYDEFLTSVPARVWARIGRTPPIWFSSISDIYLLWQQLMAGFKELNQNGASET